MRRRSLPLPEPTPPGSPRGTRCPPCFCRTVAEPPTPPRCRPRRGRRRTCRRRSISACPRAPVPRRSRPSIVRGTIRPPPRPLRRASMLRAGGGSRAPTPSCTPRSRERARPSQNPNRLPLASPRASPADRPRRPGRAARRRARGLRRPSAAPGGGHPRVDDERLHHHRGGAEAAAPRSPVADVRLLARPDALGAARATPAVPHRVALPGRQPDRVPAVDRLQPAVLLHERRDVRRGQREDRQVRVEVPRAPLRRRVAGDRAARARHRVRGIPQPASVQCAGRGARRGRRADRLRGGSREGALEAQDRPLRELAAPRRRPGLRRRLERRRVGVRREPRQRRLAPPRRARPDQGRAGVRRRPIVRRRLRRSRVLHLPARPRAVEGVGPAAPLRRLRFLLHPGGCVRSRVRRLDRPEGVRLRGSGRPPPVVALNGRLRVRVAGDLAAARPCRLVQRDVLCVRRRHRRRALEVPRGRADLGLRGRGRRRRVLRDAAREASEERADVRARRAHRQEAVDVPRREVHARRRGAREAVPHRLRRRLWDGPEAMRWVVTGAAGFIGSHLSEALVQRGDEVVGVDSFTDYYDPVEKEENAREIDVLRIDLADDSLDLDGVDGVFHLAGQPGVRSFGEAFPLYLRRNVLATQRVFQSAAEAGVRVTFASSSSVYGEAERYPTPEDTYPQPISPYGITKLACEHLAHAYAASFGLDGVGVRYFTVYGPRQRPDMFFRRVCEALLSGGAFEIYGSGEQSRSFTEVADAVGATVGAMERGAKGAVYNVGGGEEATILDSIAVLEETAGRSLDVRHVGVAKGDVLRTSADVERIRDALGWQPQTPLRDGLAAMWAWASARVAAG